MAKLVAKIRAWLAGAKAEVAAKLSLQSLRAWPGSAACFVGAHRHEPWSERVVDETFTVAETYCPRQNCGLITSRVVKTQ